MWQREQKPSTSEPGRDSSSFAPPLLKVDTHSVAWANGFRLALLVLSGGEGAAQLPSVDDCRAASRNALRQTGSLQALAIIEPLHSSKMRRWHDGHCPGFAVPFQ